MFAVRSRALACSSRVLLAKRTFASHSGKGPVPAGETHHHDDHHHHPAAEETFGKGFYLSIAAVVGCLAFYKLEQSTAGAKGAPLTRAIEYYSDLSKDWEERNVRHTSMVERAAADRSLFEDSTPSKTVNLRFPERFNTGSPYMNEIGWQGNDLLALKAHYESQRK
ncbi:uncharacterized protein LAJ45_05621 [Morchella importuna]|uniref:uncharacterized protein n=1 Tax=Morchella importuna TaxID=1174673 RepID=UPI001E8EA0C3|nr:uncharacterized protein LAJ45_05621 [Morchella importuna]KAH8150410.1 hypothetical protein LAJ45_05621 [Morchella importuna]